MRRYERLSSRHSPHSFSSGNEELDTWLQAAASTADRAGTARVHIWTDDPGTVLGYFAIAPHTIRREGLPSSVGHGAPDVLPGFLLARLALSDQLHGRGLGGELLVTAIETILSAIQIAGGRVIVVDAIDDRAHGFYRHFGFRAIPGTENRLVLKASAAASAVSFGWP